MTPGPLPDAPLERIRHNLVGLRMPRALEALDAVVQQLERGQIGAIEAIDTLLAEELTVREGRRIKAALQMARLATVKTISGFDFSFQPSLCLVPGNRDAILAREGEEALWQAVSMAQPGQRRAFEPSSKRRKRRPAP